ncbi:MAG TPA: DNA adenine methylase [Candidatus Altiarchaeales archaeon]|nr:DNA adenine methylase [Candidatus Altiarchaeales archaeon]
MEIPTIVKWAGGKKQLLDQFKTLYPKEFNDYYEPFIGGGAVFFHLKQLDGHRKYFISDNNKDLVEVYRAVKDDIDQLIKLLETYKKNHMKNPKEHYYKIRDDFNKTTSGVERAAEFIYLNKTCFNGLYRVNSKGGFNVPIGNYKNPGIVNEKSLRKASRLLQGVEIECMPFEETLKLPKKGDFIYLDPPYHPLSETSSFTSYTKEDFTEKDQERLLEYYKKLDRRGCLLMLSNSDTEFIKQLYRDYDLHKVKAKRAISCKGEGRGEIKELVITNYKTKKQTKLN